LSTTVTGSRWRSAAARSFSTEPSVDPVRDQHLELARPVLVGEILDEALDVICLVQHRRHHRDASNAGGHHRSPLMESIVKEHGGSPKIGRPAFLLNYARG
jgi:hypothetical protein